MKRDAGQKQSPFFQKKTAFWTGISFLFRPFLFRWGFNKNILSSTYLSSELSSFAKFSYWFSSDCCATDMLAKLYYLIRIEVCTKRSGKLFLYNWYIHYKLCRNKASNFVGTSCPSQRFVSSTGNMEVLLSHTHSIHTVIVPD